MRSPFKKRRKSVVLCSRSSGDSVPVASFPGMSHPAALRGLLHRGARGLASLSLRTGSDSSGHRGWWASASARVPSPPPPAWCRCGNGRGVLSVRRDRMAPSQARGDGVAVAAARFGSVGPSGAGQGPSQAVLQLCLSAREGHADCRGPWGCPSCPGSLSSRSTCSPRSTGLHTSWSETWGRVTHPSQGHPMSTGREDPCCPPLSPKELGSLDPALLG